jgi:hypothetical protein
MATITYIGRRLNGTKLQYVYLDGNTKMFFNKKVTLLDVIGDIIECELTKKGVKGPYKKVNRVPDECVTEWSIAQQDDISYKEQLNRAKDIPDGHIKALIKAVKDNTDTLAQRKRIALYIFDQLV